MSNFVAIVGRPNTGKSSLFNRLVNERKSIVDDTPGVTRDRVYGNVEWNNHKFIAIDTGGLDRDVDSDLPEIREQVKIAIDLADVIIFVIDSTCNLTISELDISNLLRKNKKRVIVCANKADSQRVVDTNIHEFYSLGFGDPVPVSSLHGIGIGDLLDVVVDNLSTNEVDEVDGVSRELQECENIIKVAIVGRPNTGKSSLLNAITGQNRSIVRNECGTTRDAIDTEVQINQQKYIFTDTAGIRRKSRIHKNLEKYSVFHAISAIKRCDVCVILVDVIEGILDQDVKIAGLAHNMGKSSIIAINKWDTECEKDFKEFAQIIKKEFAFMSYTQVISISALTGLRVQKLLEVIQHVYHQSKLRVETSTLNKIVQNLVLKMQPPSYKGKRLKIFYATQVSIAPPEFVFFVNNSKLMHFSYLRYIENQIRDTFKFEGNPIRINTRNRSEGKVIAQNS